jgi:hypothetical protein
VKTLYSIKNDTKYLNTLGIFRNIYRQINTLYSELRFFPRLCMKRAQVQIPYRSVQWPCSGADNGHS